MRRLLRVSEGKLQYRRDSLSLYSIRDSLRKEASAKGEVTAPKSDVVSMQPTTGMGPKTRSLATSGGVELVGWGAGCAFGPSQWASCTGRGVISNPLDAVGPMQTHSVAAKVVIFARRDLGFGPTILRLQDAGAIGAVVINTTSAPCVPLPTPTDEAHRVTIPFVVLSVDDGAKLMAELRSTEPTAHPSILRLHWAPTPLAIDDAAVALIETDGKKSFWKRYSKRVPSPRAVRKSKAKITPPPPDDQGVIGDDAGATDDPDFDGVPGSITPHESSTLQRMESGTSAKSGSTVGHCVDDTGDIGESVVAAEMPAFPGDVVHDSIIDRDMQALYAALFEDEGWFRELCRLKKSSELQIGPWEGEPQRKARTLEYTLSLNMRIGPKSTRATESQREIASAQAGCRVVVTECRTPHVPYGSSFFGKNYFVLAQESNCRTHLRVYGEVVITSR